MLSNLPPGVTDEMIERQCGDSENNCPTCEREDGGNGPTDYETFAPYCSELCAKLGEAICRIKEDLGTDYTIHLLRKAAQERWS